MTLLAYTDAYLVLVAPARVRPEGGGHVILVYNRPIRHSGSSFLVTRTPSPRAPNPDAQIRVEPLHLS